MKIPVILISARISKQWVLRKFEFLWTTMESIVLLAVTWLIFHRAECEFAENV